MNEESNELSISSPNSKEPFLLRTWHFILGMMTWYATKVVHPALWTFMASLLLTTSFLEYLDDRSPASIMPIVFLLSTIHLVLSVILICSTTVFAPRSQADEFRRSAREYVKSTYRSLLASLRNFGGRVSAYWTTSRKDLSTSEPSHSNSSKSDTGN